MSAVKTPDTEDTYVRETCRELDGPFDQEAVQLIFGAGVLCVDDPSKLGEAVDRLHENRAHTDKIVALYQQIQALLPDEAQTLMMQYDDAQVDERVDVVETAYLLGIAVGRRIGPHVLTIGSRGRKAGGAR